MIDSGCGGPSERVSGANERARAGVMVMAGEVEGRIVRAAVPSRAWIRDRDARVEPVLDRMRKARQLGVTFLMSELFVRAILSDGVVDYGLVSMRVVTNTGVNAIVDAFRGAFSLATFRFHALGSSTASESVDDIACIAEFTSQITPASTRSQGSQAEGTSPNIYQTTATTIFAANVSINEHAIMDQAAVPGGVCLDRSVFGPITLSPGDGLQTIYRLTVVPGG